MLVVELVTINRSGPRKLWRPVRRMYGPFDTYEGAHGWLEKHKGDNSILIHLLNQPEERDPPPAVISQPLLAE
jgi:hypothetical protein